MMCVIGVCAFVPRVWKGWLKREGGEGRGESEAAGSEGTVRKGDGMVMVVSFGL